MFGQQALGEPNLRSPGVAQENQGASLVVLPGIGTRRGCALSRRRWADGPGRVLVLPLVNPESSRSNSEHVT